MRFIFSVFALLVAFAIPAAAHADTIFDISIDGGQWSTYILSSTPSMYGARYFAVYDNVDSNGATIQVMNPVSYNQIGEGMSVLYLFDGMGTAYYFTGSQLYSGSENNPVFIPGTYSLGADPALNKFSTATLVIDGEAIDVTPEPSSLALLGTGLLGGAFGLVRRRRAA